MKTLQQIFKMKNNNLRTSLFSIIILLSIGSYAFLHTIEAPQTNVNPTLEIEQVDVESLNKQETIMPDVKIVKKTFEFLKNMVPVTQ